jgi:hypothetical protein
MIAPTAEDGKGFADTKIIMADIRTVWTSAAGRRTSRIS